MTLDDLRIAVTLLSFACFAGLFAWAWSGRNRARFDEAARLPFSHDDAPPGALAEPSTRSDTP